MAAKTELFVIDLGMGALKYRGAKASGQLEAHTARKTGESYANAYGEKTHAPLVEWGGKSYFVGPNAHQKGKAVNNRGEDRIIDSLEIQALIYSVFARYATEAKLKGAKPLELFLALPFGLLTEENHEVTHDAIASWLIGDHEWAIDGKNHKATVADITLIPQAVAALFNYAYDDSGDLIPEKADKMSKQTGFISIGYKTTELLGMEGTQQLDGLIGSAPVGVRNLVDRLMPLTKLSAQAIDAQLRMLPADRTIQAEINQAKPEWWEDIKASIDDKWRDSWKLFGLINGVGGGVELLNGQLVGHFKGRLEQDDDPVMAIANGLYKAGLAYAKQ